MDSPGVFEVLDHVEAVCKSETLVRSKRSLQLLRYLVDAAIQKVPKSSLKETVIGNEVFGRPATYDPRKDAIVRVSAGELRQRLITYYETDGRHETIRIQIPLGSYLPAIFYQEPSVFLDLNDKAAMCVANARTALLQRTLSGHEAAFKYLDSALKEHPGHPRLLSLKAMVHVARAGYGGYPNAELTAAEHLIRQAKEKGQEPWELVVVDAETRMALHFDWKGAEILFNRALVLSHGESKYDILYTAFLACQLRLEECLKIRMDAVSHLAHDSVSARVDLAMAQIINGKLDDADATLNETIALFPNDRYMPYLHLAILHEAKGDYAQAVDAIEQIPVTVPESTIAVGLRGLFIGLAGDRIAAANIYQELQTLKHSGNAFIPASQLALAAMGAKDYDGAVVWFTEAAVVDREPIMNWVAILPFDRHIQHHPGFRALVIERMKLKFPQNK